jgi:hypothetical protein
MAPGAFHLKRVLERQKQRHTPHTVLKCPYYKSKSARLVAAFGRAPRERPTGRDDQAFNEPDPIDPKRKMVIPQIHESAPCAFPPATPDAGADNTIALALSRAATLSPLRCVLPPAVKRAGSPLAWQCQPRLLGRRGWHVDQPHAQGDTP